MQTNQSVEKLGLQLMSLARKAFPMLGEKELDRMLKGRFFQALQSKWQRKLGASKVGESFSDLYDRARTAERHDQHFQTSRESQGSSQSRKQGTDIQETVTTPNETGEPSRKRVSSLKCFGCGELGHFKRNCPHKDKLSTESVSLRVNVSILLNKTGVKPQGVHLQHLVLLFQLLRLVLLNYQGHL